MSRPTPKMSRFPKIPHNLCIQLPRQALLELFHIKNMTQLEKRLQVTDGTLSKAIPENPTQPKLKGKRGISAKVHQKLLEAIAGQFASGEQMRLWFSKHWPEELRLQTKDFLQFLYEKVDLESALPQSGAFPSDYVERDEKEQILDVLLNQKEMQVCWITGPGGSGKSTLALSLAHHNFKNDFKHVFWVNVEGIDFAHSLSQIADSLNMIGPSDGDMLLKLKAITARHKVLFILDALHDVPELIEWRKLAGYLGKLVITSRTRLSDAELRTDGRIAQIELDGFTSEQAHQFMGNESAEMDRLIEYTEGLPLALRILHGLMDEMKLSPGEILERLEHRSIKTLENPSETGLRNCFDLTWQYLAERHPDALKYFLAAGMFQTRIINQALLEHAIWISFGIGDKTVLTLKRYNMIDLLVIGNEHFIHLHSLLYQYAQEKLYEMASDEDWRGYVDAVYLLVCRERISLEKGIYSSVIRFHWRDILEANRRMLAASDWDRAYDVLSQTLTFLLSEGRTDEAARFLGQVPQEKIRESNAFQLWFHNVSGEIALASLDIRKAREYYEKAYQLAVSSEEEIKQKCQSVIGLARCALLDGNPAHAKELITSPSSVAFFSICQDEVVSVEKDILLGEIHDELQEYAFALDHFYSARSKATGLKKNEVRRLAANCYRNMGNLKRAISLYRGLFAVQSSPLILRSEDGLGLAGCLAEIGDMSASLATLDKVERLLTDYDGVAVTNVLLARLWKYRAVMNLSQRNMVVSLNAAHKSLLYWRRISNSDEEQE